MPAISDPSGDPRKQKPVAKSPDDVAFGDRAESRCRDYEEKCACDDHCLCRQRPDPAWNTTCRGDLPPLAEPSSEPSQNVSEAKALHGVFAHNGVTLCIREQKSKNDKDDCGLSPKRLDELRPKTDYEVFTDIHPERDLRP